MTVFWNRITVGAREPQTFTVQYMPNETLAPMTYADGRYTLSSLLGFAPRTWWQRIWDRVFYWHQRVHCRSYTAPRKTRGA